MRAAFAMGGLPADPSLVAGVSVGVGALAVAVWAARQWLDPPIDPVAERLRRVAGGDGEDRAGGGPGGAAARPRYTRDRSLRSRGARLLALLAKLARPTASDELARARAQLEHAGLRMAHALELFYGARIALALALAGSFLVVEAALVRPLPQPGTVAVVLASLGFFGPSFWLRSRIETRQRMLARGLPDALDLLVTCVESGLGLEAALVRVVEEIGLSAPLLASELQLATAEIRAGVPRGEAFRRLATRTGLEELRNLAATLIQTDLFGTSVARALRVQSAGMRVRRTQRAEEKAATVATRMLLPLILCVLPSLFAVIMGPAAVRIVRLLLPSLAGQS